MGKKRILFVDDEPNILAGLRRALHRYRDVWEMEFVESGEQALKCLDSLPFDVLVTDIQMPDMDGIELLGEAFRRHPDVVRMVLSGQTKREKILQSIAPVHQYLSKPCDPETLQEAVGRMCAVQDRLTSASLKELVAGIGQLPSRPRVYEELLAELESEDASVDRVGELVSKDVAMTAKILHLVNSSFFGLRRRVESPGHAASLLGLKLIKALVVCVNVFSPFKGPKLGEFSVESVTDHSLAVSTCAKRIAVDRMPEAKDMHEDTLMAGLVHDVGKLALADKLPKEYLEVVQTARSKQIPLHEAEMERLGATHADVGAYLLALWGLPQDIIETVALHHHPAQCPLRNFSPLAAVHIADVLVGETESTSEFCGGLELDGEYLHEVGLTDRLPKWREDIRSVIEKATAAC